jgi:HPt (histidine-containing phosphotransfer) domain-containing protein
MLSDQILASFSTHPQRLPAFFAMVCTDLGTQLAAMKRALEAGDPAALRDAAHAATGVARGLRDPSLSRLTGEIEQQARGGNMGGIEQKLAACMALYQPLIR